MRRAFLAVRTNHRVVSDFFATTVVHVEHLDLLSINFNLNRGPVSIFTRQQSCDNLTVLNDCNEFGRLQMNDHNR